MAESLGIPEEENTETQRRRYPWDAWTRRPFTQWMLVPGIDFDGDWRRIDTALRVHAHRKGLGVVVVTADPAGLGRINFCFYDKGAKRPRLSGFVGGLAMSPGALDGQVSPDLQSVCEICGDAQTRAPHLRHVRECLVRNPNDPKDANLYARHRPDAATSTGLRIVPMLGATWTLEDGPLA